MTRRGTPPLAPRREPPPMLWDLFCREWLVLSPQTTARWWHALQQSRWTRPVELRSVFVCRATLREGQGTMRHFLTANVTPQVLIAVLEDLIQEAVVPPGLARQIQEAVLQKTHRSGL